MLFVSGLFFIIFLGENWWFWMLRLKAYLVIFQISDNLRVWGIKMNRNIYFSLFFLYFEKIFFLIENSLKKIQVEFFPFHSEED